MSKKIAIITLGVVALVAVAGAAMYIVQQRQYKGDKEMRDEQVATLPEKPEIDTSDWKVYRNEKYGFEISYPRSWLLYEGGELFPNGIQFYSGTGAMVTIFPKREGRELILGTSCMGEPQSQPIELGGKEAQEFLCRYDDNSLSGIVVFGRVPQGWANNAIIYLQTSQESKTELPIIIRRILTTIKFTE